MRTEAEMIAKMPVKVMLGETEYDIKPLPIGKSMEWRSYFNKVMGNIVEPMDGNSISFSVTASLVAFPERIADLVFHYAPELPKETIMQEASEEQLTIAFGKVMLFAYPFLMPSRGKMLGAKSQ